MIIDRGGRGYKYLTSKRTSAHLIRKESAPREKKRETGSGLNEISLEK